MLRVLATAADGCFARAGREWHVQRGASVHTLYPVCPVPSTRPHLLAAGVLCQQGSVCRRPGPHAGAVFGRNSSGALCQSVPRLPTFGAGTARPATRSTSRQRARIATAMQAPTQQEQHALRAACAGRPPPRPSVPLPRPAAHLEARWPAAPPADASPHPPSGSGGTPAATLPAGVSERPFSRPAASSEPHGPGPNTTLGVPRQRHTRLTAQDKVTPHSQERLPPRESTNTAALSDHSSVPQRPTHGLPPAASTGAPNRG